MKLTIGLILLLSQPALAQFTANGCQLKIAAQDRNQRTCETLMQLAQQACSSEQPIELQGGDQGRFDQAQQEKRAAHQLVQELLSQGHQSKACEARKRGSEAEKTINEIKAKNCQDLLSRCESSCTQLQQCTTRLAAVTDKLGSIGSSYGQYSGPLRQDAQKAGQGVAQCRQYQQRVQEAQQQARVHDQNKDLERICRDDTKKDLVHIDQTLGETLDPMETAGDAKRSSLGHGSGGRVEPLRIEERMQGREAGKKLEFEIGAVEDEGGGNGASSARSGRGPASVTESSQKISDNFDQGTHSGRQSDRRSNQSSRMNDAKSGGLKGLFQKAVELIRGTARDAKPRSLQQLGGRGRPLVDGITGATGPGLFQKISTRVHQESRLGRWVEESSPNSNGPALRDSKVSD